MKPTMKATMKPTPAGWQRFSSTLVYRDARGMIDWLCNAFGFEVKLLVEGEGGVVEHSELSYGEGLIMISQELIDDSPRFGVPTRSPRSLAGVNTQNIMVFVDDADAHCDHARAAGARIIDEPSVHDYGEEYWTDRSYGAVDPEGHLWWFTQRVRGE